MTSGDFDRLLREAAALPAEMRAVRAEVLSAQSWVRAVRAREPQPPPPRPRPPPLPGHAGMAAAAAHLALTAADQAAHHAAHRRWKAELDEAEGKLRERTERLDYLFARSEAFSKTLREAADDLVRDQRTVNAHLPAAAVAEVRRGLGQVVAAQRDEVERILLVERDLMDERGRTREALNGVQHALGHLEYPERTGRSTAAAREVDQASELAARDPTPGAFADRLRLADQRRDEGHQAFDRAFDSVFATTHRPAAGWVGHVDSKQLWGDGLATERVRVTDEGAQIVPTRGTREAMRPELGRIVPVAPVPGPALSLLPRLADRDVVRAARVAVDVAAVVWNRRLRKGGIGSW